MNIMIFSGAEVLINRPTDPLNPPNSLTDFDTLAITVPPWREENQTIVRGRDRLAVVECLSHS